ncbi:hypothetical protein G6011_06215 [Alternaria panax]|uniref:Rhodopsin domain-containing protein n=1 Tax=Alternaria panax TaxID=48097 RepID=A0AAD4FGD9_9PLEO|nr:hypothetical protein G6011_06215 [Alternaria panax]
MSRKGSNHWAYHSRMFGYVASHTEPYPYQPSNKLFSATERYEYDRHVWDVHPNMYVPERKITFALYLLYVISGGMIKISILLFYRRLHARSITRIFRIATWTSIIAIVLFSIAFLLVTFTACSPFSAFWDQFDVAKQLAGYSYHCWVDEYADLLAASIINAVQDAIAAFLPTLLYWNLQIPRRQKIALGAIFALGYLVCIVAAVRSYYVYRIFNQPLYDATWESWPAWLLCVLEIQLGAICASAPALKVFFMHYFKVVATIYGSSRGTHSNGKKSGTWWKSTGTGSATTGTMASSKPEREGYLRELENGHVVDEEAGIVLEERIRFDGRTDSKRFDVRTKSKRHDGRTESDRFDGRTESMETFIST